MKKLRFVLLIAALVASDTVMAVEEPWHIVNKSITAMLNEGWEIQQYAPPSNFKPAEIFVLAKEGRYVRCSVTTSVVTTSTIFPDPHEHVESACEALN